MNCVSISGMEWDGSGLSRDERDVVRKTSRHFPVSLQPRCSIPYLRCQSFKCKHPSLMGDGKTPLQLFMSGSSLLTIGDGMETRNTPSLRDRCAQPGI